MTEKDLIKQHKEINSLIDECRIHEALGKVRELMTASGLRNKEDQLNRIAETYRFMLHYLIEGAKDTSRNDMLADIKEQLRSVADLSLRAFCTKENPQYYYSLLRFNAYRNESVSDLLTKYDNIASELSLADATDNDTATLRKQREEVLERLFNTLLTSYGADSDYADLSRYLTSGYADPAVAAQSLSALTLSLLQFYDRSKLLALLEIADADLIGNPLDGFIAAKSVLGIMMSLMFYPDRVTGDPTVMKRLTLWADSIENYRRMRDTVRMIIGTRDTDRVTQKMQQEVIPELMKLRPEILKTMRGADGQSEMASIENNPEWEEILDKSGLNDKMRELSEMQSEGADLMMITFSNLKQYPFFNSAGNWFLPFDIRHTALSLDKEMESFINLMNDSPAQICDSDMYSLALTASHIPEMQRRMMSEQMSTQFEQINEEAKSRIANSRTPGFDSEMLKSIRDLYRFFKLFKRNEGFRDPFAKPLDFMSLPVIGRMLNSPDILILFAEFYFKRGYYQEALPIFNAISKKEHDDATVWEKIGFCHQSTENFIGAREAYEKASLLKTPGLWLLKKLGYVNRRLGSHVKAAEYYKRALDMDPENQNLLMHCGNALLETGNIGEALQHFYHANYVSSDNIKTQRAIAWCELLNGNFTKSAEYYQRIIATGALASDYLNAGHAELLLGHNKEALNLYRLASANDKEGFIKAFRSDIGTLANLGLDRTSALLILDAVGN